jgi:hypothetical protein
MNVLRIAVIEDDLAPIAINMDLYSKEQAFQLFKDACSLGRLEIVKFFVEQIGILDEPYLVPEDEFFQDPEGCGYVAYVGLSISTSSQKYDVLDYLLSQDIDLMMKAEYPSALENSVRNEDYPTFCTLLERGMRDNSGKCLRESLKKPNITFFKKLFQKEGGFLERSEIESLFVISTAYRNYEVSLFLEETYNLSLIENHPFYKAFASYKKVVERTRTKSSNKIRNWWGPLLRRINPEFVMKEAEESWKRVEKMYEDLKL